MNPRASASFCHCPKDTSTPSSQSAPSCVSSPAGSAVDHVGRRPRDPTARSTAAASSCATGHPAPTDVQGAELEAEEVLERAGEAGAPFVGAGIRPMSTPSALMRPEVGSYMRASSFDERDLPGTVLADDGDHRARGQIAGRHRRARADRCPGSGTTRARRRIPVREAVGHGLVGVRRLRGGVVLEPCQPARRVDPDAAQEADLADGRRRRTATAGCRRRARAACRRPAASSPDGHEHDRRPRRPRRTATHASDCQSAVPSASRDTGCVPTLPGRGAVVRRAARRYARRGPPCRAARVLPSDEQVAGEPVVRGSDLLGARSTPAATTTS